MEPSHAFDWCSFFALFWNEKGIKCKLPLPDTVLFRYGQVSAWWATTKDGWVQRRVSTTVSLEGVRKHFLQQAGHKVNPDGSPQYAAIVRSADGRPRLLRADAFSDFCLLLQRRMAGATSGPAAEVEIPSVIQLYVQPMHDLRYITTYTNHGHSITCSTFQRKFSRRYSPANSIIAAAAKQEWEQGAEEVGGGDATEMVASVEPTVKMQLRKLTHHIVKYIERAHGLTLLGLMCEYIKDGTGRPLLLAVLRTEWASNTAGNGAGSYSVMNLTGEPEEEPTELPDAAPAESHAGTMASVISPSERNQVNAPPSLASLHSISQSTYTVQRGTQLRPTSATSNHQRQGAMALMEPSSPSARNITTAPSLGGQRPAYPTAARPAPIITAQLAKEVEALRDDLLFQHDLAEASAAKVRQLEKERQMLVATFEQRAQSLESQLAGTQLRVQEERQAREAAEVRCSSLEINIEQLKSEKKQLLNTLDVERATVLSTLRDYHMREADLRARMDAIEQENIGLRQSLKEEQVTGAAFRRQLGEYQDVLQTFASKQLDEQEFNPRQVMEHIRDLLAKQPTANIEHSNLQKVLSQHHTTLRSVFVHYSSVDGGMRWPPSLSMAAWLAYAKDSNTTDPSQQGAVRLKSNQQCVTLGPSQCETIFQSVSRPEVDGMTAKMLLSYDGFLAALIMLANAVKPPHINTITDAFKHYITRYVSKAKKSSVGAPADKEATAKAPATPKEGMPSAAMQSFTQHAASDLMATTPTRRRNSLKPA